MQQLIKEILAPKSIFWKFTTFLCLLTIIYFSLFNPPSFQSKEHWFWGNLDKVAHGLAYLALSSSFMLAIKQNNWYIVASCFALGYLLEIIQAFLPLRQFDPGDLLANAIGCLIGFLFASMLLKNQ